MTDLSGEARVDNLEQTVSRLAEDNRRLRNLVTLLGVAVLGSLTFLVALTLVPSLAPTLPLLRAERIEVVGDGSRTEITPGRVALRAGTARLDSSVDPQGAHLALSHDVAHYSNLDAKGQGSTGLAISGGESHAEVLAGAVAGARVQVRQTTKKTTRRLRLASAPYPGLTLTSSAKADDGLLEAKLQIDEMRARPELTLREGTERTFSAPFPRNRPLPRRRRRPLPETGSMRGSDVAS